MKSLAPSNSRTSERAVFAPPVADDVANLVVPAGTSKRLDYSNLKKGRYAVFSGTANFATKFGGPTVTCDFPDGDETNFAEGVEINPAARELPKGASHVSVAAGDEDVVLSIAFYS